MVHAELEHAVARVRGQASGSGLLTWAFGARYKFSESAQIGGAFEIPIAGPRDMGAGRCARIPGLAPVV